MPPASASAVIPSATSPPDMVHSVQRPRLQHTHSMPLPDTSDYRAHYSVSPIEPRAGAGVGAYQRSQFPPEPDGQIFYSPEGRYLPLAPAPTSSVGYIQPSYGMVMPSEYDQSSLLSLAQQQGDDDEMAGERGDVITREGDSRGHVYHERDNYPYFRHTMGN